MTYKNKISFSLLVCKTFALLLLLILNTKDSKAQDNTATKNIQPSVMFVPLLKTGESYRTVFEENRFVRTAQTIIANEFLQRNYPIVDFREKLNKKIESDQISEENLQSIAQEILDNQLADIIVRYDGAFYNEAGNHYCDINLNAVHTATGKTLSSERGASRDINYFDGEYMVDDALGKMADSFFNTLQNQMAEITANGLPISIEITINQASSINFNSDIGDDFDTLSDLLDDFFRQNAHKNYASCTDQTADKYSCDDIRIPLKQADQPNIPHTSKDLVRQLRKHFGKTYGIHFQLDASPKNKIYLTLCGTQKCP